jgi:hypothetical protein
MMTPRITIKSYTQHKDSEQSSILHSVLRQLVSVVVILIIAYNYCYAECRNAECRIVDDKDTFRVIVSCSKEGL